MDPLPSIGFILESKPWPPQGPQLANPSCFPMFPSTDTTKKHLVYQLGYYIGEQGRVEGNGFIGILAM